MIYDAFSLGYNVTQRVGDDTLFVYCDYHQNPSGTSAIFNESNGSFYCFACGTFKSVKDRATELNIPVPKKRKRTRYQKTIDDSWRWLLDHPKAFDNEYLQNRNVGNEGVHYYDVRVGDNGEIILPLKYKHDNTMGVLIRNTKRGVPRYMKLGNVPLAAGLERIHEWENEVWVVENTFAYLKLYDYPAMLTMGTNISTKMTAIFRRFDRIRVLVNDDHAGYKLALTIKGLQPGLDIIVHQPQEWDNLTREQILDQTKDDKTPSEVQQMLDDFDNEKHIRLKTNKKKRRKSKNGRFKRI